MTINRRTPNERSRATNAEDSWERTPIAPAIAHALGARDLERAALLLLISAMEAVKAGTIDDVIAVLAEAEARHDADA